MQAMGHGPAGGDLHLCRGAVFPARRAALLQSRGNDLHWEGHELGIDIGHHARKDANCKDPE